ncbi:acyl carrier protein [Sphingomonas morindae]|uniref:Acyl carrier protein n=1 Tax=Sphingomonas morindae TaxID=1541170 RepID=A0ABY4X6D4_9SPHN|nr:acyl carrier protein [Sphingomonas morindae]USI72462.1 acyl carrier protein [Sphingomonas morindae]
MSEIRDRILQLFNEMWSEDHDTPPPELKDDTVLLETGFDSMAFAVLVTALDEELGFDPFTADENAVYPRTFGDFVAFYEKHASGAPL